MQKTEDEWKKQLTPEQFTVMRQKGTEAPFSGKLLHNSKTGNYVCAACGASLFDSQHKFDSGSGWPSFYDVANSKNVKVQEDLADGMRRIEVLCAVCGSHLGHVFHDAPQQPTGLRFCINSCALNFKPQKEK